mgnify:CR=1 FL=1
MSVLQKLTEGIVNRDMKKEGAALLSKWESTGLLEGLKNENAKHGMARLLENQAKELLREASTMAAGDVEGFAAVAFPIVRRVFGGLIANELVAVQPMSLPSGLIFFLDFTFTSAKLGYDQNASLYGGGRVGQQITGGVELGGEQVSTSFYDLNNGYSSPTASATVSISVIGSGTFGNNWDTNKAADPRDASAGDHSLEKYCQWDPDMTSGSTKVAVGTFNLSSIDLDGAAFDKEDFITLTFSNGGGQIVRRLTKMDFASGSTSSDPEVAVICQGTGSMTATNCATDLANFTSVAYPIKDTFSGSSAAAAGTANAIGAVVGQDQWGLENTENIPEIDMKVDSVSVTAMTKKLKAKWSPELGQDLNAYHNLDAEVELTSILSEQIALEIDREILEDLYRGATAGTYYWSRSPGLFVNRTSGAEVGASAKAPDFTGTVSEWYETLLETVNDVSAQIHRKTLRGGANFLVTSPEIASILEFTAGFRASVTVDDTKGVAGAEKVGNLSKKYDVYVDPYFPRNVVLVGRKGNSFLESGYVYAPYVPLQVTPTIFGTEDFVPRKGVMTRYAKKMVRPDMYGLVIVRGLLGDESGA